MKKIKKYKSIISKSDKRLRTLRRQISYYQNVIKEAKTDISHSIMRGLEKNDFNKSISILNDARFKINYIAKEIAILKKTISLNNRLVDLNNKKQ